MVRHRCAGVARRSRRRLPGVLRLPPPSSGEGRGEGRPCDTQPSQGLPPPCPPPRTGRESRYGLDSGSDPASTRPHFGPTPLWSDRTSSDSRSGMSAGVEGRVGGRGCPLRGVSAALRRRPRRRLPAERPRGDHGWSSHPKATYPHRPPLTVPAHPLPQGWSRRVREPGHWPEGAASVSRAPPLSGTSPAARTGGGAVAGGESARHRRDYATSSERIGR